MLAKDPSSRWKPHGGSTQRWNVPFFAAALVACAACSPTASSVPFPNADPEGPEVYYYGNASFGGKTLPVEERSAKPADPPKKKADKPAPSAKTEETSKDAEVGATSNTATPEASLPEASWDKLPGTYRGTDTLTIDVQGLPKRVETDDKAKFVVERIDGEKDRFNFKIVDSQNGGDLCSVVGTAKKSQIEFESAQSCLDEILGLPMKALLQSGTAKLEGRKLTVTYDIKLEIDGPRGPQSGSIAYRFDGDRE
jgi:hypothetical protein